jgi:uncharacterized Fe-S radical SAM superfamily protein PflX
VWVNIMDQYRPEAYADPTSPLYDRLSLGAHSH